jgi:hypothetical protein
MTTRLLSVALLAVLAGCSDAPKQEQAKVPEKPPEPVTGRRAFYYAYPAARTWAPDVQALQIKSIDLTEVKSDKGKAGAWQMIFVSAARGKSRTYTYSVVESSGNLHQGVFALQEENFSGSSGQALPFVAAALKIDTDAAYETAVSKSADYVAKHPNTPVTFQLELTRRYPDPAWRVIWGESVATSDYSVYVDSATGALLEKMH